mgnify:CR=1 FL=1
MLNLAIAQGLMNRLITYKYSGHNHKDAWTEEVEVTGVTYEPVVKNANGRWVKGGQSAYFGSRSEYYDYSF